MARLKAIANGILFFVLLGFVGWELWTLGRVLWQKFVLGA
jgi:hypothetical protein